MGSPADKPLHCSAQNSWKRYRTNDMKKGALRNPQTQVLRKPIVQWRGTGEYATTQLAPGLKFLSKKYG